MSSVGMPPGELQSALLCVFLQKGSWGTEKGEAQDCQESDRSAQMKTRGPLTPREKETG